MVGSEKQKSDAVKNDEEILIEYVEKQKSQHQIKINSSEYQLLINEEIEG